MTGVDALTNAAIAAADTFASDSGTRVASLMLATLFAVSGIFKLKDSARAAQALVDFGVLRTPRPVVGAGLATTELAVAALLVIPPLSQAGALVAATMLCVAAVLIALALRDGISLACFCFGDSGKAISWLTLARTVVIAALAISVTIFSPPATSVGGLAGEFQYATIAAGVVSILALVGLVPTLLHKPETPRKGTA